MVVTVNIAHNLLFPTRDKHVTCVFSSFTLDFRMMRSVLFVFLVSFAPYPFVGIGIFLSVFTGQIYLPCTYIPSKCPYPQNIFFA